MIIDEQHKTLFAIINKLYEAFQKKEHEEKIKETIIKLRDYTVYHFKTEKKYLREEFNFKLSEKHLNQHKYFIIKLDDLTRKYVLDKSIVTYGMMQFLRNWLISHVQKIDREYSNCFLDK